jgi:hypothetical protein
MTKRNFKKLKTMAKQKQDEPCIRLLTIDEKEFVITQIAKRLGCETTQL